MDLPRHEVRFQRLRPHQGNLYGFNLSLLACVDLETGERRWKGGRYGHGRWLIYRGTSIRVQSLPVTTPIHSPSPRRRPATLFLFAVAILLTAPALAWTPAPHHAQAETAARLVPPDLYRQIAKNPEAFRMGIAEPFKKDRDPYGHSANPDGSGLLAERVAQRTAEAIQAIEEHRPFNEIVFRLGIVAHYVADADNPLHADSADPEEARFYADYLQYMESIRPRAELMFYGFRPDFATSGGVPLLLDEALERGRGFYALVGKEYRRIGFASGVQRFDDRSTAFAVATRAMSHAISDIAEVLRYIWLTAGGIDSRDAVPLRGGPTVPLHE